MAASPNTYDSSSIVALKGLEGVQKRPGMYVGDVTSNAATHHLLYEIFDNSADEALAGFATLVQVILHEDGTAEVNDNGRGIPVDIHPTEGIPAAELIFTSLHAGGKFDNSAESAYKYSGGLHGVGASVTNALSTWLEVEIRRDGGFYQMRFEKGILTRPLEKIRALKKGEENGTRITFLPSPQYLKDPVFDGEILARRFKEIAHLNAGLGIFFHDKRTGVEEHYRYSGGMASFVESLTEGAELVGEIARFSGEEAGVEVELAFAWRMDDAPEDCRAYTNNIPQADGGQHVTGFRAALARILLAHGEKTGLIKKTTRLTAEDLREGIVVALHVRVPDPAFSSQTKEKLISVEARTGVEAVMNREFPRWLDTHPEGTKAILGRATAAAEAREAAKKAREASRSSKPSKRVSTAQLPTKLTDCSSKNPKERELYLVEGDSAGGSARQGRDRDTQAILPLRGKILNVERAKAGKIAESSEIDAMIQTLGAGSGKNFDTSRLRYGRVVIMTDADVDGSHITTLLLTFFFRQMPALIEEGHLYLAAPPLYRVRRKGEEDLYVRNDAELERHFLDRALANASLSIDGKPIKGKDSMKGFEDLLESYDKFNQVSVMMGHKIFADAILGQSCLENLSSIKPLTAKDINTAQKNISAILAHHDADAKWTLSISTDGITATRREDGIEQYFNFDRSLMGNWQIRQIRDAAQKAGFYDANFEVSGAPSIGPMSMMENLRNIGSKGTQVGRYKGLGEMNPSELWETTLNPAQRSLYQVQLVDAQAADSIFSDLMADDVAARRALIEKMCAGVSRIDM